MKFLVLTDIHGSSKFLKLAMEKYNELKCEKILLLGDILYHGPRNDLPLEYNPKEVISILNSYKDKILCVKGNCDAEVDDESSPLKAPHSAAIPTPNPATITTLKIMIKIFFFM